MLAAMSDSDAYCVIHGAAACSRTLVPWEAGGKGCLCQGFQVCAAEAERGGHGVVVVREVAAEVGRVVGVDRDVDPGVEERRQRVRGQAKTARSRTLDSGHSVSGVPSAAPHSSSSNSSTSTPGESL
jgi:hypothetical protein